MTCARCKGPEQKKMYTIFQHDMKRAAVCGHCFNTVLEGKTLAVSADEHSVTVNVYSGSKWVEMFAAKLDDITPPEYSKRHLTLRLLNYAKTDEQLRKGW